MSISLGYNNNNHQAFFLLNGVDVNIIRIRPKIISRITSTQDLALLICLMSNNNNCVWAK